ncbi:gamma-glutamyltransferase [Winogradskyella tangerina]|uniref:gamma-glutamyltransferase n=1 Tax=Winogradskyella tangerina TaxID=2023240 RepID=UPI000DBE480A|nr:gamma-glutamyltransferase [Winogradskyella tangerina]
MMRTALFLLILLTFSNCKNEPTAVISQTKNRGLITESAMVVSARKEASEIGAAILKQGGNAFDAMMATELALAVCYPYAGNLGGGGFLVYRMADGTKGALDYREKAPIAASKHMYLDENGDVIKDLSTVGSMAIGVPGTIAGIFKAQERFGNLDVQTIIKPVIELARNGYRVTDKQEKRIANYDSILKAVNGKTIIYNDSLNAGEIVVNPELAKTLERLAINGADEFYKGETAQKLVDFLNSKGSIITIEDLNKYEAKWRDPITFEYDDLTITSMSPPSSGGICLGQIMKMIEPYDLEDYGHNSFKTIQVLVEAEKRAYADRSHYLGDPDFVDIPVQALLSDIYLEDRMQKFSFGNPTPVDSISHGHIVGYESEETTHYSIVDQFGNAIAVTTTLNGGYGSKLFADELGFFLNNEMDDFSSKPGEPNYYGLIGAEANSIAPEKRMLSSMTPTIIEKDGDFYMTLGTPGGSTIITSVLQTILNVHEFGLTMQEAVDAPRFHNQWLPDEIRMEPDSFNNELKKQLEELGYFINETKTPVIGKVDGILKLDTGQFEGGADHRGDDTAVGF